MERTNLELFLESVAAAHPKRSGIVFVCIGTDRSTGDSFGPIVGTMLQEQGWAEVIGTLEKPCDAHSVEHAVKGIKEDAVVIAIDACLGSPKSVGHFLVSDGPLQPGKAIGRRLPEIGHYSIAGVVNANGPKAYWMLQTTSLHLVMGMAKETAGAINKAWSQHKDISALQKYCLPI
ncbi:putative sporulation protein YyaC [Paenibacillus castaneae]|uniref:spore protease YyaC n=1 Tax=Paenibacillus castaneae TaxID=474957 RepID=UPI001FD51006|nr:spore protease YyaC [Paenibacillus castaneae]NIK78642.1 putative sporulation protein YyaC [Paenibacillus castaneae]